jgi:hypothetical protein
MENGNVDNYQDKAKACKDCGQQFVYTAGEQRFQKRLLDGGQIAQVFERKRCEACHAVNKEKLRNESKQ